MKHTLPACALALTLAACSPSPTAAPEPANETAPNTQASVPMPAPPPPAPLPTAKATPAANILTLTGLGALTIGKPVPAGSGWAERGAQISETCITVTSPEYPGAYAIVTDGAVRRISIGPRSPVRLAEGIAPGATQKAVQARFPDFLSAPHAYVEAPAQYLTAPDASTGKPALRFEIDRDGKVSTIHTGTMPVLAYVEGCA